MSHATARRLGMLGFGLLFSLVLAAPATAQVIKAEVGVDGMT